MATPKVYADFHNLDDANRLRLTCVGTLDDAARQGIQFAEGLALTLYMDDADDQGRPDELRAEGVVHYNVAERCWVADIDWAALRHASEESSPNPDGENGSPPPSPPEERKKGIVRVRNDFTPEKCGFWFGNDFKKWPVVEQREVLGYKIQFGNSEGGLCGGMVFAALDYFLAKKEIPKHQAIKRGVPRGAAEKQEEILYEFLSHRHVDSFSIPNAAPSLSIPATVAQLFNTGKTIATLYEWVARPQTSVKLPIISLIFTRSVPFLTTQEEWPKVKNLIHDWGKPVPLTLVKASELSESAGNHQVLAYGYDFDFDNGCVRLYAYDPNYPKEEVTLEFETRDEKYEGQLVRHSKGHHVRGFFVSGYVPEQPP